MNTEKNIVVYCQGSTDTYCICLESGGLKVGYRIESCAEDAALLALNPDEAISGMYDDIDGLPEWVENSPRFIVNGVRAIDDYISFWHEELWSEMLFIMAEDIPGVDVRNVPSWALPYFVNGDSSGLSADDEERIKDMEKEFIDITHWSQEPYFCGYEEVYRCIVTLA